MKEIKSNGLEDIISQAIEEMKSEQGNNSLWKRSILPSWNDAPEYSEQSSDGSKPTASTKSLTTLYTFVAEAEHPGSRGWTLSSL